ncbi:molybdopterin-binding protein [Chroococcidiopsis sp. CCALA 051]|uniref:molybdopterin-dependent oxidoreductase n=1 Tax=Chroococcidiopsis sp. CCALA 051 TaxID=869949 RepID=UPI000D0D3693|nr:molybdopterin-dependent oxidoreductase [Chroococcidiopsis sp. CCALA 051]MBE9016770.1 molybdopterin-dependent oxidoreductase [Chroococcidiopsidales cyanobacterium LEGE 13417]PSM46194.1 molybdopterin-binding protein [Chroococcidiopsis sp. CCALA 051]
MSETDTASNCVTRNYVTPNLHRKPNSLRYYQDGPPKSVDIDSWHLSVTGLVQNELDLSYSDILALPQVEESRRMVCVCNWSIRRTWAGVLLSKVIEMAGVRNPENLYLKQTSIGTPEKGVYESTIALGDALFRRALLLHSVDGEPLPIVQGYPLRLIDFGLYGYKNVKGLSKLEVTDQLELGEWENRAGYDVDGTVRPKKYRIVDLAQWRFVDKLGEVTDY